MAEPDNPFFATALVNRYWKHFFGRGLVDPEDDMRVTNPPTQSRAARRAGASTSSTASFDLKELVRTICTSHDLSAQRRAERVQPRRQAELLALLSQAAERRGAARRDRPGDRRRRRLQRRAAGHAGGAAARQRRSTSYFLTVFGRPDAASACECERSQRGQPGPEPAPAQLQRSAGQADRRQRPARRLLAADKNRTRREKAPRAVPAGSTRASRTADEAADRPGPPGAKHKDKTAGLRGHRLGADQHQGIPVQPLKAADCPTCQPRASGAAGRLSPVPTRQLPNYHRIARRCCLLPQASPPRRSTFLPS